jgi:hypothetical protein
MRAYDFASIATAEHPADNANTPSTVAPNLNRSSLGWFPIPQLRGLRRGTSETDQIQSGFGISSK